MCDVTLDSSSSEKVYRVVGLIGSRSGASKTQSGGLSWVNVKPKEVMVFNMDRFEGRLKMFKDLEEYIAIVTPFRKDQDYFLAAVNFNAAEKRSFSKKAT